MTAKSLFYSSFRHHVKRFLNDERNDGGSGLWMSGFLVWWLIRDLLLLRFSNRRPLHAWCEPDWLFDCQVPDQGVEIYPERGFGM